MPSESILVTGTTGKTGAKGLLPFCPGSNNNATLEENRMGRRVTAFLIFAGLLLLVIGGSILLAPHSFHGSNGIALGDNPNLLSEVRAPGGMLTASGIVALIGAIRANLASIAILLSVLVYGSFGVARILSMIVDGMPAPAIVAATVIELAVSVVGVLLLWRIRR